MPRFIEGQDRQQVALIPECLDDVIADDNPVRIIDAFVDELNLESLGFEKAAPAATGRPSYPPGRAAEDLHLRLLKSGPVQSSTRARVPTQCRTDVAGRPSGASLQDHRRFPP